MKKHDHTCTKKKGCPGCTCSKECRWCWPGRFLLTCRAAGLPDPKFEFPLAVEGKSWKFDAAWPAQAVAVEREGFGGRHTHFVGGVKADMEKYNSAALIGWRLFRFTTDQTRRGEFVEWVRAGLVRRFEACSVCGVVRVVMPSFVADTRARQGIDRPEYVSGIPIWRVAFCEVCENAYEKSLAAESRKGDGA